jgi:long-chain acyl-CoA synthetase
MPSEEVKTLKDLLLESADRHPDRPALALRGGHVYTYRETLITAASIAAAMQRRGVQPGDRVALLAENSPEWGMTYLGTTAMGAVIVPILTDFHAAQVESILRHAEPRLVVVSDALQSQVEGASQPAPVVTIEALAAEARAEGGAPGTSGPNIDPNEVFAARPDPDDVAAIIYTSGTTGSPKGVMLTHGNLMSNVLSTLDMVAVGEDDRLLSILPLAHTYECTIGFLIPFRAGASITYLSGPPVISSLLPALAEVKPTMMLSVPLIMEKIYRSRVAPVVAKLPGVLRRMRPVRVLVHRVAAGKVKRLFGGALRFFGIGGAALSEDTERFLREGRFPYAIGYGLTETSPLIVGTDAAHTRFRAAGRPIGGVEVRILPQTQNDADVPRDAVHATQAGGAGIDMLGEIQVRGPNVMKGYFRNPEATAETFTEDGWLRTGDLGTIDRRGYVYIRGRSKTTIIGPSGENIFPEEIEAAIEADEVVEESLVMSEAGSLVARVRINVEKLAERLGDALPSVDLEGAREHAQDFLNDLRKRVNARLNRYSRVSKMDLQEEPFERTPTKKIKRFRYKADGGGESSG